MRRGKAETATNRFFGIPTGNPEKEKKKGESEMIDKEFFELVKQTRAAQKRYFNFKKSEDLRKSKELERQLDTRIAEIEQGCTPQTLF